MSKRKPFRDIRSTSKLAEAAVALLMGLPNVTWEDKEYSLFLMMVQMSKGLDNPSYTKVMTLCGAWLKLLKRLISRLPEGELRDKWSAEFVKLSEGFEGILEDETNPI